MTQEIETTLLHARNAPREPARRVMRDNVLDTIDRCFESTSIVFVEGEPQSGKSELAAQYMMRHDGKSVGAFLTDSAAVFYSTTFLQLSLVEQIHFLVHGTRMTESLDAQIDDVLFNRYVLRLQSLGRKVPITFVIDGFADSEKIDREHTLEIFNKLPAVQSEFRFLITGSDKLYSELNLAKKGATKVPRFPLSSPESIYYLSDINIQEDDARSLHTYANGNIGLLSKLRSMLVAGDSLEELLENKRGTLGKIFEYEWNVLNLDKKTTDALGYLAFSQTLLTTRAIAELMDISSDEAELLLKKCRLIEESPETNGWSFRSDAQRRFIISKLIHLKACAEESLINRLLSNSESRDATSTLPSQLYMAGRHVETLNRLCPEHFSKLLAQENSLRALNTHAQYGVLSARDTNDIYSELRFSLIQSVIHGTSLSASTTFEIEALLALGEEDAAAALSLTASSAEERLRQLSSAAGCFAKRGKTPPDQIMVALKQLLEQLEDELPEAVLITIAAELLPIDADLALKILDKKKPLAAGRAQEAKQSAQDANNGTVSEADQGSVDAITRLEGGSKLRPVLDAATFMANRMSAQEVLDHADALDGDSHKLFILQRWLEVHRRSASAADVALKALDLVLRDTSKSPRVRDIREIAVVAPYIKDRSAAEHLVSRLEAQSASLVGHGTSEETIRLKMIILRAKQKWSPAAVDADLIDIFSDIHEISDVGIRTACYAWMLYHLGLLTEKDEVENRTGVFAETTKHLIKSIDLLLSQTADHYAAAIDAIRALCMASPQQAIDLVARINTEERRNHGYSLIVRCIALNKTYSENVDVISVGIDRIVDPKEKEKAVLFLLYRICANLTSSPDSPVDPRLLVLWKKIIHVSRRTQGIILTYKVTKLCSFLRPQSSLIAEAKSNWGEIHERWLKIDIAYWVVSELATVDKPVAEEWLSSVKAEIETGKALPSFAASQLYWVTSLAARVFSIHVAASSVDFERALIRISYFVEILPSLEDQIQIWTQIGVSLWYKSRRDLSQSIISKKIDPILSFNFENDVSLHQSVVLSASPILYLCSAVATNDRIDRVLSLRMRDEARDAICSTLLRKMLPGEFFQERDRMEFELEYSEAMDILSQIKLMQGDSYIYKNVKRLCNSVISRKNNGRIRRNQLANILVELEAIARQKLPDVINIRHDGFLIATLAQIHRAKLSAEKSKDHSGWLNLKQNAEGLTNAADRVIVLSIVASCANGGGPFADGKWFEAVKNDIASIPSDRDRIERYQWVSEILETFDKSKCRTLLKDAMKASAYLTGDDANDKRQRLLDLAHNIDPSFVPQIIDIVDFDEASAGQKRLLDEHTKLLNARKDAATDVRKLVLNDYSQEDLTEIAIRNISALNAGRQIPQATRDFMELADITKNNPFQMVYPVWLWIIESGLRKAAQKGGAKSLPLMFDFICNVASVATAIIPDSGKSVRSPGMQGGDIVGPGSRDMLFEKLKDWVVNRSGDKIKISDPYFSPDDLEIVKAIAEVAPDKEILIITSREQVSKKLRGASAEEAFRDAWDDLCDGDPPRTDVVVIGFGPEGKHPIHDRWVVSSGTGLRLGSSTNSIGMLRISEVSEMDKEQSVEKDEAIDRVLDRNVRIWQGQKLHKAQFSL